MSAAAAAAAATDGAHTPWTLDAALAAATGEYAEALQYARSAHTQYGEAAAFAQAVERYMYNMADFARAGWNQHDESAAVHVKQSLLAVVLVAAGCDVLTKKPVANRSQRLDYVYVRDGAGRGVLFDTRDAATRRYIGADARPLLGVQYKVVAANDRRLPRHPVLTAKAVDGEIDLLLRLLGTSATRSRAGDWLHTVVELPRGYETYSPPREPKECRVCKGAGILRCSGCRTLLVYYCSLACQRRDWKEHKLVCDRQVPRAGDWLTATFPPIDATTRTLDVVTLTSFVTGKVTTFPARGVTGDRVANKPFTVKCQCDPRGGHVVLLYDRAIKVAARLEPGVQLSAAEHARLEAAVRASPIATPTNVKAYFTAFVDDGKNLRVRIDEYAPAPPW